MAAPEGTRAIVLIADYIAIDAGGKVNALGAGFVITGLNPTPAGNLTSPMFVAAIIDFPARVAGSQVPITVELRNDDTDTVVTLPDGNALRIQQLATVQRTQAIGAPGIHVPDDLPCRFQAVMGFPGGLPLDANVRYSWKLEINGTRLKGWQAKFYVAAAPPPPIIGGPAGPASIPNVVMPPAEMDDEQD